VNDPKFVPELIEKKSQAGKSICMWCKAIDNYSDVLKIIKPKQADLEKAESKLKVANDELRAKEASLDKVIKKLADLNDQFEMSKRKLAELTEQKEDVEVKLQRAEKLVVGLADESKRWKEAVKILEVDLVNLMGNILLAAGYISYVGPFTSKYRAMLLREWQKECTNLKIPFSPNFQFEEIMGDPVQIREWNICGLPADSLSIENGIIVTQAKRWPLIVDPQSQGNKWIKRMERDNNIQVIKLSTPKFQNVLTNSIKLGQTVLLENIDEQLDPFFEPILSKNYVKSQGQWVLKMGDQEIPYSMDFKLFITTKLPNPHYLPEICIKVTIINFTVTREGLED